MPRCRGARHFITSEVIASGTTFINLRRGTFTSTFLKKRGCFERIQQQRFCDHLLDWTESTRPLQESEREGDDHGRRLMRCVRGTWNGRFKMNCPRLPPGIPANYPLKLLKHADLPQVYTTASAKERSTKSTIRNYDTGGQLGIRSFNVVAPVAMRVSHVYWDPQSVALRVPPADAVDTTGNRVTSDVLSAPTTKMSGGCYENGSDYFRGADGTTSGQFRTYNFCKPSGGNPGTFDSSVDLAIGSPFEQTYVFTANGEDGVQRQYYAFEVAKMSGGQYHTLLFDPFSGTDKDYMNAGVNATPSVSDGWSIFETHFAGSTASTTEYCGPQQQFTSEKLTYASDSNGPFTDVDYSKYTHKTGDCTTNDSTYGAYYTLVTGATYWRVDSSNSF